MTPSASGGNRVAETDQHTASVQKTTTVLGATNVAVASWNIRSLSLSDPSIRTRKQKIVHTLLGKHQVLCLLEMRGTKPAIRKWLGGISKTHEIYISHSGGGEATAGLVILLQKAFARLQHVSATFASVSYSHRTLPTSYSM